MLSVAQAIVENGFVVMSTAFWDAFSGVEYSAEVAHRRFLQMPLVCIIVGEQKSGRSVAYLLEIRCRNELSRYLPATYNNS